MFSLLAANPKRWRQLTTELLWSSGWWESQSLPVWQLVPLPVGRKIAQHNIMGNVLALRKDILWTFSQHYCVCCLSLTQTCINVLKFTLLVDIWVLLSVAICSIWHVTSPLCVLTEVSCKLTCISIRVCWRSHEVRVRPEASFWKVSSLAKIIRSVEVVTALLVV